MYQQLADFFERPAPFSRYTTDRLWTDPHVARQMLCLHLDTESDLASRRPEAIDAFVAWLDRRLGLEDASVLDLGCGPGLYAERMAKRGARVTGVDFSAHSLDHGRASATKQGLGIDYRKADYLTDPLPGPVDIVTLIYGDFCAVSPDRRRLLLDRIAASLAPGAHLVFDVFSPGMFGELEEKQDCARHPDGGFWGPADHFSFSATFLYSQESISLDRYLILRPEESFEICNWMQYYSPESITAELAVAGFRVTGILDLMSGEPWQASATAFAVVAERG